MKILKIYLPICLVIGLAFSSCKKDEDDDNDDTIKIDNTAYVLDYGDFPAPLIPIDNQLTVEKVKLGKMLFYEKKLSNDLTMSCSDCHKQADAFTDIRKFSVGTAGLKGGRQAMPIFNMGWHRAGFFWDGRAPMLRDQALLPIQDPLEMNETLENVVTKLAASSTYTNQFIKAFGSKEITSEKVGLAMEQFMLTILSMNSKYDQVLAGKQSYTASELRGEKLFFKEYNEFLPNESGADCAHCHGGSNFDNSQFMNNGLDKDSEFDDIGYEKVSGQSTDKAKFKVPSLRNIELTPPYMHDGRFATLSEVVDHYNSGIDSSSTLDRALDATRKTGLRLSQQDKDDLVAFLKTLTDPSLAQNEAYNSPF
ncbi:MAG: cytochrome-c peroxidase [Salibacteraceae bacterium]